ncbi:MAG: protein kinase [Deltaproteobacteria bacterium]|nr:protein kinase [Deltaproteobacteria bacterium]
MKSCPTCRRLYPDDAGFCPVDGIELRPAADVVPESDKGDPRLGRMLAERYQIRRVVADGGMGRVYEALDITENRRLALKVLHANVARDSVAVERFKREFEISRLLPHEHIVEVYDFQKLPDESYVLVMDYLEGDELRNTLKREKVIRPERVVRMLSQLAIGLDEAHRRNLIHRDLKPDNIFLCGTREGDVIKLLDFGSVKDKSEGAKKLTVMGTTIGSPYYMSPEQAQGLDTLDARADVWALAAITYEALTGQVPFKGNNGPSILLAILTEDPKPPSVLKLPVEQAAAIPTTLDDVLEEAFAKNVAMRVPTVGSLADRVGQAYGLSGSHRDWAYTPVQELADRINAELPGLLARRAPNVAAVETDPFAEADPFKAPAAPVPIPQAPPIPGAMAPLPPPAMNTSDFQAAGVPKGPPLWIFVALGLVLLSAVTTVVITLALRR